MKLFYNLHFLDYDLTFVADLPGLKLENYVSDLLKASVEVLKGRINVEIEYQEDANYQDKENTETTNKEKLVKKNFTLEVGDKMDVIKKA